MVVTRVLPSSFASQVGIEAGDRLISVDGQPLRDSLDLAYAESVRGSVLKLVTASGRARRVRLPGPLSEKLGFELEQMKPKVCGNKCLFCFIHQMPKGMRRSLYVKDEDYRYSFLFGNFITLTNLEEADIDRIRTQSLSPLYVSVHATDEAVRRKLLGNPAVPQLLPLMRRLAQGGARFHCQVVLCPGINDGPVLERTIEDLFELGDAVVSVGVVPVGLTGHRRGLPQIDAVKRGMAAKTIDLVESRQKAFRTSRGVGFVYAADELYLRAGRPIPSAAYYDGFPQIENGVGIARRWLDSCKRSPLGPRAFDGVKHITVVTGMLAAPLVAEGIRYKLRRCKGVSAEVCPVPNRFFGRSVTVAGLLSGRDIVSALSKGPREGIVCIPPDAVNADGLLLDDMSLPELASRLGLEVRIGLRGRRAAPRALARAGAA
jgi:putative radical SAM enzyme (TIGR03279 family)